MTMTSCVFVPNSRTKPLFHCYTFYYQREAFVKVIPLLHRLKLQRQLSGFTPLPHPHLFCITSVSAAVSALFVSFTISLTGTSMRDPWNSDHFLFHSSWPHSPPSRLPAAPSTHPSAV